MGLIRRIDWNSAGSGPFYRSWQRPGDGPDAYRKKAGEG
jgi:hypothetical protein